MALRSSENQSWWSASSVGGRKACLWIEKRQHRLSAARKALLLETYRSLCLSPSAVSFASFEKS